MPVVVQRHMPSVPMVELTLRGSTSAVHRPCCVGGPTHVVHQQRVGHANCTSKAVADAHARKRPEHHTARRHVAGCRTPPRSTFPRADHACLDAHLAVARTTGVVIARMKAEVVDEDPNSHGILNGRGILCRMASRRQGSVALFNAMQTWCQSQNQRFDRGPEACAEHHLFHERHDGHGSAKVIHVQNARPVEREEDRLRDQVRLCAGKSGVDETFRNSRDQNWVLCRNLWLSSAENFADRRLA